MPQSSPFVRKLKFTAALAFTAISGFVQAAPETYFGEDLVNGNASAPRPLSNAAHSSFLARLSSSRTETFESAALGGHASLVLNLGASGTATLTGSIEVMQGSSFAGRFPISGSKYLETSSGFTIVFSEPQTALGFSATDVGDFSGQLRLTYSNGSSETVTVPHTLGAEGAALFFGLVDAENPFTSVTFLNSDTFDGFGFDDLIAGIVTPVITPTGSLPDGMVGQWYSQMLTAAVGMPPLTWSATGLPSGLSIDSATGGVSGIPTTPTVTPASIDVTVNDSSSPTPATVTQTLSLSVLAASAPGVQAVPALGAGALGLLGLLTAALGLRRRAAPCE